jgi:hypothetical protein
MRRSRLNDSVVAGQRHVHSARMSWTRWSLCVLLVACEAPPPSAPFAPASTSARASAAPARSADAVDCSDFCRCWRNCSPYQQEDPCPQCKKAGCASTRCGASERASRRVNRATLAVERERLCQAARRPCGGGAGADHGMTHRSGLPVQAERRELQTPSRRRSASPSHDIGTEGSSVTEPQGRSPDRSGDSYLSGCLGVIPS